MIHFLWFWSQIWSSRSDHLMTNSVRKPCTGDSSRTMRGLATNRWSIEEATGQEKIWWESTLPPTIMEVKNGSLQYYFPFIYGNFQLPWLWEEEYSRKNSPFSRTGNDAELDIENLEASIGYRFCFLETFSRGILKYTPVGGFPTQHSLWSPKWWNPSFSLWNNMNQNKHWNNTWVKLDGFQPPTPPLIPWWVRGFSSLLPRPVSSHGGDTLWDVKLMRIAAMSRKDSIG